MPAVLLVLATALGGVQLSGLHLRLQDAVADAARMLGRGEDVATASARAGRQVPGAQLSARTEGGGLVCARLVAIPDGIIGLTGLQVQAGACALSGGE